MDGAGDIDLVDFLATPTPARKEVESGALAVEKGMVDEEATVIELWICFQEQFMEILIGDQEFFLTGFDVHPEDPVIGRSDFPLGPVQGIRVAGYQPQTRQAAIIKAHEEGAISTDAAIANGGVLVAIFTEAFLILQVIKHGKDPPGFRVAVIEEELGLGLLGVPVEHGALLGVPAAGFIQCNHPVILPCIDNANSCGLIGQGHAINPVNLETENITAAGVPRDGLALADIAEEMVTGA